MSRSRMIRTAAALAFAIGLGGYAAAQPSQSPGAAGTAAAESVRSGTVLTIHGKIAAVNKAQKFVTLEAGGKNVTFKVENPYNLNAAKVGDPVVVRYYEVVTVRKKKAGEDVPSASLTEGIATAKSGTPGAVAGEKAS